MLMSDRTASQVYYKVDNVEPWMSGNARGATSAFCLLVRLGQLRPTDEQVQQLLDHTDSPYIRAVGACRLHLYQVRYCTTFLFHGHGVAILSHMLTRAPSWVRCACHVTNATSCFRAQLASSA